MSICPCPPYCRDTRDTEPRFQPSGGPPLPSFAVLGTGAGRQEGSPQPGVSLLPPLLSLYSALSLPLLVALSRSISVPGSQTRTMTDTYAVVQKRGAPAGAGRGTRVPSSTDTIIYSQVTPRSQRPVAHTEDATGTTPPGRGELGPARKAGLRATRAHLFSCSPPAKAPGGGGRSKQPRGSQLPNPVWPRPGLLIIGVQAPK